MQEALSRPKNACILQCNSQKCTPSTHKNYRPEYAFSQTTLCSILGVDLDSELTFDKYVSNTVSSINFSLRNIRLIRKLLNREATEMLVHSVITNKLDMCNSLLMGTSVGNIAKLQRCQNLALRVVLNLPARSPISDHLKEQHWLKVKIRIHFKMISIKGKVETKEPRIKYLSPPWPDS